jgi:ATP-dependent DNA helicase RecG
LILQHLVRYPEIDTATAARMCQRPEAETREVLNDMEQVLGYLERGGSGRGTYWTLRPDIYRQLAGPGRPERVRRIDWEAAKTRMLSVLKQRAKRGESGLSNSEIRQITHLTRYQVVRLMRELMEETPAVRLSGARRYARYSYTPDK